MVWWNVNWSTDWEHLLFRSIWQSFEYVWNWIYQSSSFEYDWVLIMALNVHDSFLWVDNNRTLILSLNPQNIQQVLYNIYDCSSSVLADLKTNCNVIDWWVLKENSWKTEDIFVWDSPDESVAVDSVDFLQRFVEKNSLLVAVLDDDVLIIDTNITTSINWEYFYLLSDPTWYVNIADAYYWWYLYNEISYISPSYDFFSGYNVPWQNVVYTGWSWTVVTSWYTIDDYSEILIWEFQSFGCPYNLSGYPWLDLYDITSQTLLLPDFHFDILHPIMCFLCRVSGLI